MYVCMYVCMFVCMFGCSYLPLNSFRLEILLICSYVRIYLCKYVWMFSIYVSVSMWYARLPFNVFESGRASVPGSNLCSCVCTVCMYVCMYVCKYVCMYAGMFLCTQICANFLHIFNSVLHTHKYIQTQCVCISLLDTHRSRYASKKDAIRHKSRNESAI